jgi:hypothetical protein
MSIVRFASVCDHCGKRGPEYEAYLSCRECGRDLCPACRNSDFNEEERGVTICATGVGRKVSNGSNPSGNTPHPRQLQRHVPIALYEG